MNFIIENFTPSSEEKMLHFLKEHENTSLFLLGNFESYGPYIGSSPFSGNYKLIRSSDKIIGVFALTKKGNLFIESAIPESLFDKVIDACQEEGIPIEGLFGNWEVCSPFWSHLKKKKVIQKETYAQKEILYTINPKLEEKASPFIRQLKESDLEAWLPLRLAYISEYGFPSHLTAEELKEYFLEKVEKKIIWGYFIGDQLVSIADLNAKAFDLGQVGGVYTLPTYRRKGYSKALIRRLFHDSKELHAIRKLIIFTGKDNLPACKVYESLGCKPAGFFALFFGNGIKSRSGFISNVKGS